MRLFSIVAGVVAITGIARADSSIPGEKPQPDGTIEGWIEHCQKRLVQAADRASAEDRSFVGWEIELGGETARDYITWQLHARPRKEAPRFLVRIGPSLSPFVLRSPAENDRSRAVFDRSFQPAISGCMNDLAAVVIQ